MRIPIAPPPELLGWCCRVTLHWLSDSEVRIQRFKPGWQRVNQCDKGPLAFGHHREANPDLGTCFDVPRSIGVLLHVARIVDSFICALDNKPTVEWVERKISWHVFEADAVIQAPRSVLLQDQVTVTTFDQFSHRDVDAVPVG